MKYRIKERIDANGDSTFVVQEHVFWWWENYIFRASKQQAEHYIRSLQTKEVKYHTVNNNMHTQKEKQLLVEVTPPGEEIDNIILDEKQKPKAESENQTQNEQ
jgi:hypothetical protein